MIAGSLLMIPWLLVAPAVPAPSEPLAASAFDVTAFPDVLFDVTPPARYSAVPITTEMVELGGVPVESVTPVDPATVVVSLVIDDGPTVTAEVLNDAQGASVELVRNAGDGMAIALATPSGLQSALTSDRGANIARIAGITAGAPDVVPLAELMIDAAIRLAESPEPDRHLVVVHASPVADGAALDALAEAVESAGIVLHLVVAPGVEPGRLGEIAIASGGLVPVAADLVAAMDRVTAAVSGRYRVAATVAGEGPQELALTVGGERFTTEVAVAPVPVPTTAVPDVTAAAPAAPVPETPTTQPEAVVQGTVAASPPTTVPESPGGSGRSTLVLVALGLAVLVGLSCLWVVLRRRSSRTALDSDAQVVPPRPGADGRPSPTPVIVQEPSWAVTVEPGSAPNVRPEPELEREPEPEREPDREREPDPEPDPVREPELEREPDPEPDPEREPELELEPVREPERGTVPEPDPVEHVEPAAVIAGAEPDVERQPDRVVSKAQHVAASEIDAEVEAGSHAVADAEADPVPPAPSRSRPGRVRAGASMRRSASPRRRGSPSPARPAQPARAARRATPDKPTSDTAGWLVIGDLRMHSATGEVWAGSREVHLTPAELGVLELLMTSGGHGVTREAIIEAAHLDEASEDGDDPDAILAQLRRKTRIGGARQSVRKERVALYFFGDEHGDDES